MKCKTCGKNSEGEYCFQHKPRKPLPVKKHTLQRKKCGLTHKIQRNIEGTREFFVQIWNNRKEHNCENCGKWLGKEPLSYMFDHLLEKSKHPDLAYKEDNIMLVCLECHDNKTRGILTDLVKQKIDEVRKRYDK